MQQFYTLPKGPGCQLQQNTTQIPCEWKGCFGWRGTIRRERDASRADGWCNRSVNETASPVRDQSLAAVSLLMGFALCRWMLRRLRRVAWKEASRVFRS